jgi:hypothetical protein
MIANETDQGLLGLHLASFDRAHLIQAAVGRDLDNHVADWGLALIIVGGTVIIMLVAYALVKRFLRAWRAESSSQTVAGITAMVMTMFAVLVAFVIVNLYSSYESAANNVALEATSLSDLVRDAGDFPPAARTRIERAVAQYVVQVRQQEFHTLRQGHADPRTQQLLDNLFRAVQSYEPQTNAQQSFYGAALDQLHAIADERESRIQAAETAIPDPLLYLLILLAVLTLATSLVIDTHHDGLDVAVVVVLAVVVSAGLFTAVILQYPFSGSIAVSSEPFDRPPLAQLVQRYT